MTKIGAGQLQGFLRQGHKEIAQALPAFPDSMRTVEEPGMVGNLTPQEVVADKNGYQQQLGQYARQPQPDNTPGMER